MSQLLLNWISNPVVLAALIAASAALGTAIFAFVAAIINASVARRNAILSAQIAQRTKRAEFRQAWINQLRDSFSKLYPAFAHPTGLSSEAAADGVRILLLMNRNDPDYERMREAIFVLTDKKNQEPDAVSKAQREFITVSQDILKREWEVVKSEINRFEQDAREA